MDKLLRLKKQLRKDEIVVSVNDFVIKSVANALMQYPEVNVHWINEQVIIILIYLYNYCSIEVGGTKRVETEK